MSSAFRTNRGDPAGVKPQFNHKSRTREGLATGTSQALLYSINLVFPALLRLCQTEGKGENTERKEIKTSRRKAQGKLFIFPIFHTQLSNLYKNINMYTENDYFIHLLPAVIPAQGRNYLSLGKYVLILSLLFEPSSNSCELCCVQTLNNNNGEHIWRAHVKLLMQKFLHFPSCQGMGGKRAAKFHTRPTGTGTKAQLVGKIPQLFQGSL